MWITFIGVLWVFLYHHWRLESLLVDDLCRLAYFNLVLHTLLLNFVYGDFLLDILHLTLMLLLYLVWGKVWWGGLPLELKFGPLPIGYCFTRDLLLRTSLFKRFAGILDRGLFSILIILPGVWVVVLPGLALLGFLGVLIIFTQWWVGYNLVVRDGYLLGLARTYGLTFQVRPVLGPMLVVTFAYAVGQFHADEVISFYWVGEYLQIGGLSGYEYVWAVADIQLRADEA